MESLIESWIDEKQSSYLYDILAEVEAGKREGALFANLSRAATKQAGIWAAQAQKRGLTLPDYKPSLRARTVGLLARALGPRRTRHALAAMKVRGLSVYTQPKGHPMPTNAEDVGKRHRGAATGGSLRAAVFGVNDGLVSNASLILGVAGASASPKIVVLSGVAGLLAGAFSMASGEYVSVRSQREVFEYQIGLEREELGEYPEEEAAELALIYEARGISKDEAERLGARIVANPAQALDTLAREELGLDPEGLGSPWTAAGSSLVSFAAGAMLPLLPYLLLDRPDVMWISIGLSAAALFAIGATLSLFTGRSALKSGLRMLLIGAAAGASTFLIGRLLGVNLS